MGVDLGDLVPRQSRRLQDFQGKTIAIDAYNALYQFLAIIRQPDGTPLKDPRGRVTSHLSGLFYRTANLAEAGIKPVFVFDGKPHELKRDTLDERRERKEKAQTEYQEAVKAGDLQRAFSKAQQTSRLTGEMVDQAKRLLDALGIPWVQAPSEGEAQASVMAKQGVVWAAGSQDYDALLFGTPRLVRNVTVTGRRKLPGKSVWIDVEPEEIDLERALNDLQVTQEQLVAIGILVGTDFNKGIKGVGPKRALKLVKDHGTLDKALAHLKQEIPEAGEIQRIFLQPESVEVPAPKPRAPQRDAVVSLLVDEHAFSRDRVLSTLERFQAFEEAAKQKSLDAFF